jgi:hypothetical protein
VRNEGTRQLPQKPICSVDKLVDILDFETSILEEFLCLTELTKHAILSYPLPDQQSGEKFAAFTYLHNDAQNPICGTAHNVVSPEMLYISGSSGAQFDQRARQLRKTDDVMSAIEAATA